MINLQNELTEIQNLEQEFKNSETDNVTKLILLYAIAEQFYTDPQKLSSLNTKIEKIIKDKIIAAGKTGEKLGLTSISKFLTESQKKIWIAKEIDSVLKQTLLNNSLRVKIALLQYQKDFNVLKSEILISKKIGKLAGLSEKEIINNLIISAQEKTGFIKSFTKKLKTTIIAAERRERSAKEISALASVTPKTEDWQWIAVSGNICPDCKGRAGKIMSLKQWQKLGLPGSGRTICGSNCKCKLIPVSIADKRFPDAKSFKWNPKNLVLTTDTDANILKKS